MKKLIEILVGKSARGIPVSEIKMSVHSTYPTEKIPLTEMHIVIADALQEIHNKLNEH